MQGSVTMSDQERIDGHEAYRDDPTYTAPEMKPGNGELAADEGSPEFGVVAGTGMTGGVGGGALAGEVLVEEVEEDQAEMTPRPDPGV
jgi:hypothetical protein